MRSIPLSAAGILAVLLAALSPSSSAAPSQDRSVGKGKKAVAPPSTVTGWIGPVNHVTGSPVLNLTGWAGDARSGAPVARVEILFNDKVVGLAELNEARRDVVQALKRPDFLKSGWKARIDLKGLRPGTYRLAARAWNPRGESNFLNTGPVDIRIP
jgi:hypothetical protein